MAKYKICCVVLRFFCLKSNSLNDLLIYRFKNECPLLYKEIHNIYMRFRLIKYIRSIPLEMCCVSALRSAIHPI